MAMGVVACGGGASAPRQDLSASDPVTNNPGGNSGSFSDGNCNYDWSEVLAENPLYEESTRFLTADFDAGLPYYIQIPGYATAGAAHACRLVVIE